MNDTPISTILRLGQAEERFLTKLHVQGRVIHALMLREILTRFGRENLGFFWLMGEPFILCLGVITSWSLTRGHLQGDVGIVPFVLSGYTLLTLWRHIIMRAVRCFKQNSGLMFHRNVNYLDTLIARFLLEVAGTGISFLMAYTPFYLFGIAPAMYDPLLVVGAWLLMAWFSFGVGMILAGLSEFNEIVERFIHPIMYVTLPLTGLFYLVAWLPTRAQHVVLWSPLVHCTEMLREGLIGRDIQAQWSFGFMTRSCLLVTALGLVIVRAARRFVEVE